MRRIGFLVVLILFSAIGATAQVNTISTVAGGGPNSGTAGSAYLPGAFGVVWDKTTGNTYISVTSISVVYKVDSSGNVTPYAGNGLNGFSGDGGPATSAKMNSPYGLAVDGLGNLYIADSQNNRIREVSTSGTITTYAGSGNQYDGNGFFGGYSGDTGPATSAMLNSPEGVAVDANGNLFIADTNNSVIRKVDNSANHIITTYAGGVVNSCSGATDNVGDGCPAAQGGVLSFPVGVAVDSNGNVYIGDFGDSMVRLVNTANPPVITAYAGSTFTQCTGPLGDGSAATSASLCGPQGVVITSNDTLYIADTFYNRVRAVDPASHNISTIAGTGTPCLTPTGCGDGGLPTTATLNSPSWLAVNGAGSVIVGDPGTNRFRIITTGASPTINNFAGTGVGGDGAAATSAVIGQPYHVAVDNSKNVFLFDNGGARLREVNAATQDISDVAGNGAVSVPGVAEGDGGLATAATFSSNVLQIWLDKPTGKIYIADDRNRVARVVTPGGNVNLVAGIAGSACAGGSCGDGGSATSAQFASVSGIATDSNGNVYVADGKLNRVRIVCAATCPVAGSVAGNIYNYAGTGTAGYFGDGGAATSANLNDPFGLAVDANNNLYIADALNNRIRMVDTSGTISTVAFNGQPTFGGDGGSALSASMQFPQQVALDGNGNLFVGGGFDNVVQRVDATSGTIITVAGDVDDLDGGFNGDGIASTQALIENYGLAIYTDPVTQAHTLYIGDAGNNRVRAVPLAPAAAATPASLQNFGVVLPGVMSAPQLITVTNNGLDDLTISNITAPTGFQASPLCPSVEETPSVAPGGSCIIEVAFSPAAATPGGTNFSGNVTFNTTDPNNPSFSYGVSGSTPAAVGGVQVNVLLAGVTTGATVTSSTQGLVSGAPGFIDCTTTTGPCSANFAPGEQVILAGLGEAGTTVTGWSVGNSTTTCLAGPTCTFTMPATATDVTATFGTTSITVSAMGNGSGTIIDNQTPPLIDCIYNGSTTSGTCTAQYPAGTAAVLFTATPTGTVPNSSFAGWLGFCSVAGINSSGTGPCNLNLAITLVPTLGKTQATAVFSVPPQKFGQGDVFVGTVDGMIFEYTNTGTLVQVLNSGSLGGLIAGMAFDVNGKLYAANPAASIEGDPANVSGTVETFDGTSATGTIFGTNQYNSSPIGVMIDMAGDVFVGQSAGQNSLLQFVNTAGMLPPAPTFIYYPAYESNSGTSSFGGGIGYLDLLSDNTSVLYSTQTAGSNELGTVKDYDIVNLHQNPDFAAGLTGGPAFAISQVSDGSVLVANTTQIVRLASNGTPMGAPSPYKPGGGGLFYALALDPSGTSFWTGDALSGKVYQVQLSTGNVLTTIPTGLGFNSSALNFNTIFGIAVLGEAASGGTTASMAMTAPEDVVLGTPLTYTIQVTNPGGAPLANVTVTDNPLPGSLSAVSLSTQCTGTTSITCTIPSLGAGQTVSLNFTIVPTALGELSNTAQLTGGNSVTVDTNVVAQTGTFPLVVEVDSANPADFVTSSPAAGTCTQAQLICTSFFPSGTMVTLTPSDFGNFVGWSVNGAQVAACGSGGSCTVTMSAAQQVVAAYSTVAVASSKLSTGVVGIPYNSDLSRGIIGGAPPYTITLTGTLPGGLAFAGTVISGTPTTAGNTPLTVNITDSLGDMGSTPVTLSIINAPTGQEALANGNYGILIHMVNDSTGSLTAGVGSLHFNGAGLVNSGTFDLISNPASPVSQTVSVTGTYTIGPDNRGLIELTTDGAPFATIAMSVGDIYQGVAHTAHIIRFDDNTGTGFRGAGIARLQDPTAFNSSTFAGTYIIGGTGQNTSLARVTEEGVFTINSTTTASGTFGNGSADLNDNGTLTTQPISGGTYSEPPLAVPIDPSTGRTQWTSNSGVTSGVLYIIDADNAVVLFTNTTPGYVLAGTVERQLVTSFDATALTGPDVVSRQGPSGATGSGNSVAFLGLTTFTPTAGTSNPVTGTVSVTYDFNDAGNLTIENTLNGTYSLATNGRAVFTFPSSTVITYLSRADHGYEMTATSAVTDPQFGELDLQTGGPFANALFATNFFWGEREPNAKGAIEGVTSVTNNTLNATIDQTHADGRLDYGVQDSFGFEVAPNGRFLFTNNDNTPQVAGDVVGLTITRSHVVFTELDPTNNHPSLLDGLAFTMPAGVPVGSPNPFPGFGTVQVGSSSTSATLFVLTNNSDGLLSLTSITNPTDFSASSGTCVSASTVVVLPHSSCNAMITFKPTVTGPLSENITFNTDGGNLPVAVTGTGSAGAPVTVNVSVGSNNTSGGSVVDNMSPHLIDCTTNAEGLQSGTCSASYGVGSMVTFTETPNAGAAFSSWSGPCNTGTGGTNTTCTITVTNPIGAIEAAFTNGPGGPFTLTVALPANTAASTGNGTVTSVGSGGIGCTFVGTAAPTPIAPASCSNSAEKDGEIIQLTPEANTATSSFAGWAGSCPFEVTGPPDYCFVTMSQSVTVTPVFTLVPVTVKVTLTGNGSLVDMVNAGKINCTELNGAASGTCSTTYNAGSTVTLTETPGTGYSFTPPFGGCSSQTATTCTLSLNASVTTVNVTATFTIGTFVLNVSTEGGNGTGTVTSNANNLGGTINCGPNNQPPSGCGLGEQFGAMVVLSEVPTAPTTGTTNTFTGWSASGVTDFTLPASCITGAPASCTFSMPVVPTGATFLVTATFTEQFELMVTDAGTGTGNVKSQMGLSPAINCSSGSTTGCAAFYSAGQAVMLTAATTGTGSTFAGWSGAACSGVTAPTCSLTMTQPLDVTATFNIATGPTLQSITVTPANAVIPNPGTEQFTATGMYSDGSTQNLTTSVTWTVSNALIAAISNTAESQGLLSSQGALTSPPQPLLNGAVVVTATLGNISGSTSLVVGQIVVADFGGDYDYTTGYDDKQRTDGTSKPLVVTLTNTSTTQTVTFTTVTADNPAYTVSMNCTSLAPGQTCTVPITYKTTAACQNLLAHITVNDNDPGGSLTFVVNGYGADTSMQVDDLSDSTLTAQALAQSLVGPGVTISNVTYTGSPRAAGNFTTSSNILGFTSGVVLSTGSVHNVMGPNCVSGATVAANDQDDSGISVDNVQPGDSDLTTLVKTNTFDAAVLEFDFVPTSPTISFQYVFASDEYNEFVNQFNDGFGFYVNGTNVALIPGTTDPVSINNVNDGNPIGTNPTNPQYYHNNEFAAASAPYDTEMNGLTVVLTAQATVTPNQSNHIKLAIADASDHLYDSNVFIAGGSLSSSAISFSPTGIAFGNQNIGVASAPQTVTITNNGTTAVTISSITATPPFNVSGTCPELAPSGSSGSTCTVSVTVTPTSATTFNGSLIVQDNSPAAGSQQSITLSATGVVDVVTHFSVSAPAKATSASPFSFTVTAQDASNNTVTTYAGTVQFTSSDDSATLPPPSKLTNGVGTFQATLFTAGTQTITATDTVTASITGTSGPINVIALQTITVTPANPTIQVGAQQQFTATGTFTDGSTQNLTNSVTWSATTISPEGTVVASIVSTPGTAGSGLATGLAAGSATITAAATTVEVSGSTTLTVSVSPFTLSVVPPPAGTPATGPPVPPGGTLTFGITLTGQPGFSGTVMLSCTTDTPSITCQPAPAKINLVGATQVAIVLDTFCTGDTLPLGRTPEVPGGGIGLLLAAILLGGAALIYRRQPRWALTFAVLMLAALGTAACGGGPAHSPTGQATPAGPHFVILTATTTVNGKPVSASTPPINFVVQ